MSDKIFQIGVFHDEVRSEDESVIINEAKKKMAVKYGHDFEPIDDKFFTVEVVAEKSVNLVTLDLNCKEAFSKVNIINDLCQIYMKLIGDKKI